MDWHLSATSPDWQRVREGERTYWQRLAVRTKGVVTPGNITSFIGVTLVIIGAVAVAEGNHWQGLICIGIGRLCDILDGIIAHKTGTKSPLGEATDASFDKIGAIATLIVFGATNLLWWPVAVLIGLQNLTNSFIGLIGRQRKYRLHPLPVGKLSTAGEWVALLGFGLAAALGQGQTSGLSLGAYAILAASLALGLYATVGYAQSFWSQRHG